MQRYAWRQFGVATAIALAMVFVAVTQPSSSIDALSALDESAAPRSAIVSLVQGLHDDLPIVIVFVPAERCKIQYCVTGDLVAHRLAGQEINVVEAPVYAVRHQGGTDGAIYPLIDWGVYLVEPFVNWLPEFSDGEFGYGLDATAAVMIDGSGDVVFRHQPLADIDGFAQEAMAYAETRRLVNRAP